METPKVYDPGSLVASIYDATPEFRAIDHHVCVALGEGGPLIAITGPYTGDDEADATSMLDACMFAAAPDMARVCQRIIAMRNIYDLPSIQAAARAALDRARIEQEATE